MADPTRVYPVRGTYLEGVPHATFVAPGKGVAEALVATGAFTLNANDSTRDSDAPNLGDDPQDVEVPEFYNGPKYGSHFKTQPEEAPATDVTDASPPANVPDGGEG